MAASGERLSPLGDDPFDQFIFTVKDAQTGLNLLNGSITRDGTWPIEDDWYSFTITLTNMDILAGRAVSFSYSAISYFDTPTSLFIDDLQIISHCQESDLPPPAKDRAVWWETESKRIEK